ncbi:MAG: bifunctional precorrin-2 dehydrogenase/sirohydrochlorin ferrochelatase [Blautia sp.]|nr:bifunctional precorrin-2 dehydrogenase/sirohydrochlorin ferrochelatase [Blautia sp.]
MNDTHLFFPLFVDLTEKKVVVVGGGTIAARRIRTLLPFCRRITVLSPSLDPSLQKLPDGQSLIWIQDSYQKEALSGAAIVLACTDDPSLNEEICRDGRMAGALVNSCSKKQQCDFYFPGILRKDPVVVGITASGQDHHLARMVRERIQSSVMEDSDI